MTMKKLIISMFVLLTAAEGALAQGLLERYNVTNLDVRAGLPHNHVNGIFADSRGFVWISSYGGGAVRYDGYTYMRPNLKTPAVDGLRRECDGDGHGDDGPHGTPIRQR